MGSQTASPRRNASRGRRDRGAGTPSGAAPATPPRTELRPVTLRTASRPGRLGPLRVQQLVLVEAAVALGLAAWAERQKPVLLGAFGAVALLLLVAGLLRPRGLGLGEFLRARSAFRQRQRRTAQFHPDAATDAGLIPALECEPALRVVTHAVEGDRTGRRETGMVGDGTFLSSVLLVEPRDVPLRPQRGAAPLPLDVLRAGLTVEDIVLGSVQVVQFTQPAPAPHLPEQAAATRAYRQLADTSATPPGLRLTWVALRLDPELCPGAVQARGGGEEGARKALQRATDQLAARLHEAGFSATVLDESGVAAAVSTATCLSPLATAHSRQALQGGSAQGGAGAQARRSGEFRRAWRCDDRWHTTYWVSRWPQLAQPGGSGRTTAPELLNLLTATPALATTFSLTVRAAAAAAPGSAAVSGHIRVTARSESDLAQLARQLETRAHSAGAALVRLDMEQVPGVLATLPLGGTR